MSNLMIDSPYLFDFLEKIDSQSTLAPRIESQNIVMDERLVDVASVAMRKKLEQSREKGRSGWWTTDCVSLPELRDYLNSHIEKGDMVDVMNIAAMIWARELHLESK